MAAGDRKPRSEQRRATKAVAFRILPAQQTALAQLAQRRGAHSPNTQARDILLRHLDYPDDAATRLDVALHILAQIRTRCITLTGPLSSAHRQSILGEIMRMIDGAQG